MTTKTAPTVLDEPATAILQAVEDLAPTIRARAPEIEAARRLPGDLLTALVEAGCFRMLLPPSHGGYGLDVPEALRVYEALARADASVAWTVMIGSGSWFDLTGLSRATFDSLFDGRSDVIFGGAISPSGTAERVDGGHRVKGRWAFVSGCEHCDWLYANCIEMTNGQPELRIAVFSPSDVEIEDTWHVMGLCGTGSHHIAVHDVFVPEERTVPLLSEERCLDEPIVRIPPAALFAVVIASVALGIGQGALDDVLALAVDKVPLLAGAPLSTNPLFQYQLGAAVADLRAARASLHADAEQAWATALDGADFTLEQRAHLRSTAARVTDRVVSVVETAYHAGGGSALYLDNPLQRRLRDIHALTQHFLMKADTLTISGSVLTGQDLTVPLF